MAFNYGHSNSQIPRPEIMDYERVGQLALGGPSHSGLHSGYSPDHETYKPTVELKSKSPDEFSDDDNDQPIIKKLFTGEKCRICERPAKGIKYNAISCDSCRVFFRRIVLIKDKEPHRDSWSKCVKVHIRHRSPELSELQLNIRCQHCRLKLCYENGMQDRYVTSSKAGKKRKADIQRAQELYEEKKRNKRLQAAITDTMRALPVSQIQKKRTVVQMDNISYMMVPIKQASHFFTNQQESLGNQLLQFWEFYRDPSSEQNSQKLMTLTQAATSTTVSTKTGSTFRDWMLRKNRLSKWRLDSIQTDKSENYEHLRDGLLLHHRSVMLIFNFLPELDNFLTDEIKHNMTVSAYGELMVMRWVNAARSSSNGDLSIKGVTGQTYNLSELQKLGLSDGFMKYFAITKKLREAEPDSLDMALMCALSILTCDRGVPMPRSAVKKLYSIQEMCGEILHQKCKIEQKPKKFTSLMNVLIQLRETVKHVDIAQISEYRRKIMSARQSASQQPQSTAEPVTAPPDLYQSHPSTGISRVPSSRGPIIQELPSSPGSPASISTISNSARLPTGQYSMSHTQNATTTSMYRSIDSPSLSTDSYSSSVSNETHDHFNQNRKSSPVPYSVIQSFQSSSLYNNHSN